MLEIWHQPFKYSTNANIMRAVKNILTAFLTASLFCTVLFFPTLSDQFYNPRMLALYDHSPQINETFSFDEVAEILQTRYYRNGLKEERRLFIPRPLLHQIISSASNIYNPQSFFHKTAENGIENAEARRGLTDFFRHSEIVDIEEIGKTLISSENQQNLLVSGPSLILATGYGISLTRPITFLKAVLNQLFGRVFQIMPPFFTVIPEVVIMLNTDGTLGTLGCQLEQRCLSPMYIGVFIGFVGLHWRLLTQPLQVFMGAAIGVLALGTAVEPDAVTT
jgi:hypothetical protein